MSGAVSMPLARRAALGLLLGLAGCGLSQRAFIEQVQWPLDPRRPVSLPPLRRGKVLLVRSVSAVPGLDARGLQTLLPNGSVWTDFYNQWAVPPALAIESALRLWLADAGLFAAVIAPGSRLIPDLVLEGTLTAFLADRAAGTADAALSVVLLDQGRGGTGVVLQRNFVARPPLAATEAAGVAQALQQATADLLGQIEAALRPVAA
jgi:ABC-type uncharacterized transport system auxiliary subunit